MNYKQSAGFLGPRPGQDPEPGRGKPEPTLLGSQAALL